MRRTAVALAAVIGVLTAAGVAAAVEFAAPEPTQPPPRGTQLIGTDEAVDRFVAHGASASGPEQALRFPGAPYVKLHLAQGRLHPGDVVVVADRSGTESYRYPDPPAGGRWTTSVSGDTAVISIEHPATSGALPVDAEPELGIRVDRAARGFTAAEASARRSQRTESICGGSDDSRDAVCYRSSQPVAYRNARAVARLLIDGTQLCTAWRVGPRNRMLTNNHCVADAEQLRVTEVWFDYECFECGGSATRRPVKVGGADLLATDAALDFTLFSVDEIEAVAGFGFLTLDMRQPQRGEELYIPQHPRGAPTAIAMSDPQENGGNCVIDNPRYDGYATGSDVSYFCDTDGGSSGSPVISRRTDKVIALHHLGGCPNTGVRVDLIAARIGALL